MLESDFDVVSYLTDAKGNRTRAVISMHMFLTLVHYFVESRQAQTANTEVQAKLDKWNRYRNNIVHRGFEPDTDKPSVWTANYDEMCAEILEQLGDFRSDWKTPYTVKPPIKGPTDLRRKSNQQFKRQTFFAREFIALPPPEVQQQIAKGVYFIRAWRIYRGLTRSKVAELFGKTVDTISWHENGYTTPKEETLRRFAEIFDCSVQQLTVAPGSTTAPWLADSLNLAKPEGPTAPSDTDYPDVVLGHMLDGKSPLKAWRLYRGLSLAELGARYGTKAGNMRMMEDGGYLRKRTIQKLCPIFRCKPEQLLRPEGLKFQKLRKRA